MESECAITKGTVREHRPSSAELHSAKKGETNNV